MSRRITPPMLSTISQSPPLRHCGGARLLLLLLLLDAAVAGDTELGSINVDMLSQTPRTQGRSTALEAHLEPGFTTGRIASKRLSTSALLTMLCCTRQSTHEVEVETMYRTAAGTTRGGESDTDPQVKSRAILGSSGCRNLGVAACEGHGAGGCFSGAV